MSHPSRRFALRAATVLTAAGAAALVTAAPAHDTARRPGGTGPLLGAPGGGVGGGAVRSNRSKR